jgi:hypothetical protein
MKRVLIHHLIEAEFDPSKSHNISIVQDFEGEHLQCVETVAFPKGDIAEVGRAEKEWYLLALDRVLLFTRIPVS